MPDQSMPPAGTHNPRNNLRQHKRPTRRHPGSTSAHAPVSTEAEASAMQGRASAEVGYPAGRDAASQEAAARAAYEEYAAATYQPHPGAANHPQYGSRYQSESGYAGFAATAGNPRVAPARPTSGQMSPYDSSRYRKKGRKKAGIAGIVAAVVILGAIGVGVYCI